MMWHKADNFMLTTITVCGLLRITKSGLLCPFGKQKLSDRFQRSSVTAQFAIALRNIARNLSDEIWAKLKYDTEWN